MLGDPLALFRIPPVAENLVHLTRSVAPFAQFEKRHIEYGKPSRSIYRRCDFDLSLPCDSVQIMKHRSTLDIDIVHARYLA